MATQTETTLHASNAESPDAPYAIVAGLYVATLLAPVAVLVLSRGTADDALLYIGFLAAVTAVAAVAGLLVARTPGFAIKLGGHFAAWLLAVLPLRWVAGVFGGAYVGMEPPAVAVPLAIIGTGGGMVLGLVLLTMSRNRYAAAVLADSTEFARWEARWPRRWRRVAVAGMIVAGVAAIAGVIVQLVVNDWHWVGSLYVLLFVWTPVAGAANPRTVRVTDVGLVVERPLQQRLRPWSAVAGYSLTDDALIVHQTAWWRLAYRSDRADIEDLDSAVAALEKILGDTE